MSFARQNEVFGDVPVGRVASCRPGSIRVDGKITDWPQMVPAVVNPVGDYVLADINKGGSVRDIYLASDGLHLYVRVDCARRVSRAVVYHIDVYGFRRGNLVRQLKMVVKPGLGRASGCSSWAYKSHVLETSATLRHHAKDECLFIRVETKEMGITVDNTGWRACRTK